MADQLQIIHADTVYSIYTDRHLGFLKKMAVRLKAEHAKLSATTNHTTKSMENLIQVWHCYCAVTTLIKERTEDNAI